jgi:hypothetical protein
MVRLTHIRPAAATKIYAKAILPVTPQPDFRNPWGEQLLTRKNTSGTKTLFCRATKCS